jgi:hypothetical protein
MGDGIEVRCEPAAGAWTCRVMVTGHGTATLHEVTIGSADLERLDPGATTPDDLVSRSFAFLLEREPKESILRRFDLQLISHYFPEYEGSIRPGPSASR